MADKQASYEPMAPKRGNAVTKRLWAAGGIVAFGLALVGIVLPVLPTTPLVLVAAFCFARSSERLDTWFKGTKLYRQVFESFVDRRTMTVRAKLTVLVPVTMLLALAAFFMRRMPVMLVVLAVVWIGHVVYFGFRDKTEVE